MWATLRYAVFFIGGAFTGMIALCVVQSGARTDEMYFIERLKKILQQVSRFLKSNFGRLSLIRWSFNGLR